MFNQRKKLNAIWIAISIVGVISMIAYLILPVLLYR